MIYTNLFPGGRNKALTLSYDDGVANDLKLMELMRKYGIKGTFNVNSGWFGDGEGRDRRLTAEEVREHYRGFEVAVHGYKHSFLDRMVSDMIGFEIAQDRHLIEKTVGYPVRGMAYAYGAYNDRVMEQLRSLGIVYARTTQSTGRFSMPEDFLKWHPTCHHDDGRLDELCERFLSDEGPMNMQLFYLWGHSYEFDRNGNWDRMEGFMQKMGGDDRIWYASNMEVYEYIQASRRLITSCDGEVICNPSAVDVWVMRGRKKKICIPAGKMIKCGE